MWIKYIISTILFFILALSQASFFLHFSIFGIVPNFVFTAFIILLFFNKRDRMFSLYSAFVAGFFQDIFSTSLFGLYIVCFLVISFFAEKLFGNLRETQDKYPISYFVILFLLSFIFVELALLFISYYINKIYLLNFNLIYLIEII